MFDLQLIKSLDTLKQRHRPLIISIDGRSGSGKTSLATALANHYQASVIHIDDFFMPASQQTEEQLAQVAGNIDFNRFIREVKDPLQSNLLPSYHVFSCKTQSFTDLVTLSNVAIVIIEGAYSQHPIIADLYHYKIFLTHDKQTQKNRIRRRNGFDGLQNFINQWIPREENYFKVFNISHNADYIIDTRHLF